MSNKERGAFLKIALEIVAVAPVRKIVREGVATPQFGLRAHYPYLYTNISKNFMTTELLSGNEERMNRAFL